jgi:hypothetical protein
MSYSELFPPMANGPNSNSQLQLQPATAAFPFPWCWLLGLGRISEGQGGGGRAPGRADSGRRPSADTRWLLAWLWRPPPAAEERRPAHSLAVAGPRRLERRAGAKPRSPQRRPRSECVYVILSLKHRWSIFVRCRSRAADLLRPLTP